ncbi:MAG: hypothetical protein J1E65_02680 [Lachnospiraceae bacterium]|nr:hypothetical protein [Lachnospiraceae bacterium]
MDNNQNMENQNNQFSQSGQYTQYSQNTANDPYAQNTQYTQYPYGSSYDQYTAGNQYGGANIGSPIIETGNRPLGILGAALGAIAGGVVWTIIGCLGFISGWIAVLIFFMARFGYKLLGKVQDTFGNVISIIFGLIVIFPATWAAYAYSVWKALNDVVSIGHFKYIDVVMDLAFYMERHELWGNFAANLAMGYGFTILVAVCYLIGNRKSR